MSRDLTGNQEQHHDINKTFTLNLDSAFVSPTTLHPEAELPSAQISLPPCSKHGQSPQINQFTDSASKQASIRLVHNCTALNAAVILGQQERVKALLAAGAALDVVDCTGSTAISEAAYHCHVDIMKLLLDSGAHVNTANRYGLTPLSISSCRYKGMRIVNLLIKRGANVNLKAKDGRSALHLAAEEGHRWITKKLLQCESIDLEYINSNTNSYCFCPSPLLLAASQGYTRVMETILDSEYPYSQAAIIDAYLVLWAVFTLKIAAVSSPNDRDDFCRHALKMREELSDHDISGISDKELRNTKELQDLLDLNPVDCKVAKSKQCLLVLERCLGQGNKQVAKAFRKAACIASLGGDMVLAECLLVKALELLAYEEAELAKQGIYKMPGHLQLMVSTFMVSFWEFGQKYRPAHIEQHVMKFVSFIKGLAQAIDVLLLLKPNQVCSDQHGDHDTLEDEFVDLLSLIACATASEKFFGDNSHHIELESVCRSIIVDYFDYCHQNFTSLLHLAVSNINVVLGRMQQTSVSSGNLGEDAAVLVSHLLEWGCAKDINTPYMASSERLLHRAVVWADMDPCLLALVDTLLSYGAHYCIGNSQGKLPFEISQNQEVAQFFLPISQSPLPLACIASKVIVDSGIDYQSLLFISPLLKKFIKYHK